MKWCRLILCAFGLWLIALGATQAQNGVVKELPGWGQLGKSADGMTETVYDTAIRHGDKASGCLKYLKDKPAGFVSFTQTIRADTYRGKRVRLSGFLKTADVSEWTGLFMRIDGDDGTLGFDNMHDDKDRALKGTEDWKQCEVVLDVPQESVTITLGAMLYAKGTVWVDDLKLEPVDQANVPVTNTLKQPIALSDEEKKLAADFRKTADYKKKMAAMPKQPVNLDFEKRPVTNGPTSE